MVIALSAHKEGYNMTKLRSVVKGKNQARGKNDYQQQIDYRRHFLGFVLKTSIVILSLLRSARLKIKKTRITIPYPLRLRSSPLRVVSLTITSCNAPLIYSALLPSILLNNLQLFLKTFGDYSRGWNINGLKWDP